MKKKITTNEGVHICTINKSPYKGNYSTADNEDINRREHNSRSKMRQGARPREESEEPTIQICIASMRNDGITIEGGTKEERVQTQEKEEKVKIRRIWKNQPGAGHENANLLTPFIENATQEPVIRVKAKTAEPI